MRPLPLVLSFLAGFALAWVLRAPDPTPAGAASAHAAAPVPARATPAPAPTQRTPAPTPAASSTAPERAPEAADASEPAPGPTPPPPDLPPLGEDERPEGWLERLPPHLRAEAALQVIDVGEDPPPIILGVNESVLVPLEGSKELSLSDPAVLNVVATGRGDVIATGMSLGVSHLTVGDRTWLFEIVSEPTRPPVEDGPRTRTIGVGESVVVPLDGARNVDLASDKIVDVVADGAGGLRVTGRVPGVAPIRVGSHWWTIVVD